MVKDLSYLQAFTAKTLRSAGRILQKGFTAEDIKTFLEDDTMRKRAPETEGGIITKMEKPCCGDSKIDKELAETRAKQKERKARKKEVT